jgi:uncharacterized protein YecE (DUF72 family)
MVRKTRDDFEFIVKAHKAFSHEPDKVSEVLQPFKESLQPLIDAGKTRLRPSFSSHNASTTLPKTETTCRRSLTGWAISRWFVEFRHISWVRRKRL